MHDSSLYPPNSRQLSDSVIGQVVTRHTALTSRAEETVLNYSNQSHRLPPTVEQTRQDLSENDPLSAAILRGSSLTTAAKALALRRQIRRKTQQRYRKKLLDKRLTLEEDVRQLQAQIQQLKLLRDAPHRPIDKMAKWSMVIEYVRLFRNGFRPSVPVSELCRGSAPSSSDIAYTQTRFIQGIMAPDVRTNAGYGVEADLEEWRIISLHHVDLSYKLVCLETGPEDSVIAHVTATTLVTANMLRRALPRHATDEKRDEWAAISAKLVGQKLEAPTTVYFGWDRETSRFISTSYESDMLTPLVRLLGSLEYASSALSSPLNVHHWSLNQCH